MNCAQISDLGHRVAGQAAGSLQLGESAERLRRDMEEREARDTGESAERLRRDMEERRRIQTTV